MKLFLPNKHSPPLVLLGKFSAVGGLATVVFFLSVAFFVEKMGWSVMLSTCIAFILVVLQNYILHYRWTFNCNKQHAATLFQFFIVSASGFFINAIIMYAGVYLLESYYLVVQCIAILAVVIWNFTLSTQWVFKEN